MACSIFSLEVAVVDAGVGSSVGSLPGIPAGDGNGLLFARGRTSANGLREV